MNGVKIFGFKDFKVLLKSNKNNIKQQFVNMLETHREHKIILKDFLVENNNDTYILLMFDNDTLLIGMCRINLLKDHYYINMVHIHTSQRGKGLCAVLMKYVVDFCANNSKFRVIKLDVESDNEPAIRCYKKVGFKIISETSYDSKKIVNMECMLQQGGNKIVKYKLKRSYV